MASGTQPNAIGSNPGPLGGGGVGGPAPVDSVFGRTGAVVAVADDYAASQVDNDSAVSGAHVSDALDVLAAAATAALAITAPFMWGANNVFANTVTRYLFPMFDNGAAQTSPVQVPAFRAGTIKNMRVMHNAPAGNGNDIVYTLRVAGAASALTVTLASDVSQGSNLVNTVAVTAGQLLDVEVTKAAAIGASPIDVVLIVEYA